MGLLNYLTVQDILWINLQVGKKVNGFNYAKLEEATYYQYAYGESKDVPAQAERFLRGFVSLKPLAELNELTGLIGVIAFLEINGFSFELEDLSGATFLQSVLTNSADFKARVQHAHHDDHGHKPSVRATIESVLRAYPDTIAKLANPVPVA